MKKQASDQYLHDRRYQERKRAQAAKRPTTKKVAREGVGQNADSPVKDAPTEQ
jgi:hypothetical protein